MILLMILNCTALNLTNFNFRFVHLWMKLIISGYESSLRFIAFLIQDDLSRSIPNKSRQTRQPSLTSQSRLPN